MLACLQLHWPDERLSLLFFCQCQNLYYTAPVKRVHSEVLTLLSAGKFFWYLLFTLLTLLYYTFYGLLAVVLSPNLQISSVASTLFYAIWNLFSGFLITLPQMPVRTFPNSTCSHFSLCCSTCNCQPRSLLLTPAAVNPVMVGRWADFLHVWT